MRVQKNKFLIHNHGIDVAFIGRERLLIDVSFGTPPFIDLERLLIATLITNSSMHPHQYICQNINQKALVWSS